MKKYLLYVLIIGALSPLSGYAQFEAAKDSVVQLFGIIMTSDSLVGIPAVSVTVQGTSRGTISNGKGVFSIVALKGDVIELSHVSYKPVKFTIPRNIEGTQYSVVQLLTLDVKYLPATIIKPRPTPEQFARDFVNSKLEDDDEELARRNASYARNRALLNNTPAGGGEAARLQLSNIANRAVYQGQVPPMNIFNPAAWADFIQSWKRGDYKKKN